MADFYPVLLAGGSGTRFWPRSRRARAKQVLSLDGEQSMIQQTAQRLKPLAAWEKFWIITNDLLAETLQEQLREVPREQMLLEPAPRNTAPAAGLAAGVRDLLLVCLSACAPSRTTPPQHPPTWGSRFRSVQFSFRGATP